MIYIQFTDDGHLRKWSREPFDGGVAYGEVGSAWRDIETCPMWEVALVTDGENVAITQKAEADYGGHYWSIEPEDALEWEPTLWQPWPARALLTRVKGDGHGAR